MLNSSKQIKFGAILSYLSIALNIVSGLIFTPWIIRSIGQDDYALNTLANSLMSLFVVDFGLSAAVSKFVSQYHAEGREDKVEQFLSVVFKLYLIIDLVIFAILTVVYFRIDHIYSKFSVDELQRFKIVYLIAGSFSVVHFPFITLNGILNAYEKFVQLKLMDVIYRAMIVIFTIVALVANAGVIGVVAANSIAGLITTAIKFVVVNRHTRFGYLLKKGDRGMLKSIATFSLWATVSSLANRLIFAIMPTILGVLSTTEAIAVFGVASSLEQYSYTLTSAINGMFMPRISSIIAKNDSPEKELLALMIKVGKFQLMLNGLVVVGLALVGKEFIVLWTGAEYTRAYYGVILLILPGIFFYPLQVANTLMVVKNKIHYQSIVALIVGVCNVMIALFLVPRYGELGACISICVAYMMRSVLYIWLHKYKMKMDMMMFFRKTYGRISLALIMTLAVGIGLNYALKATTWFLLAVKVIIICIVFVLSIFFAGMNKDEKRQALTAGKKLFTFRR